MGLVLVGFNLSVQQIIDWCFFKWEIHLFHQQKIRLNKE